MKHQHPIPADNGERGAALVMALMMMALLLALSMAMSLTAISELGVSSTYSNQTQAFQAAEAGLYHAMNLTRNYIFVSDTLGVPDPGFTSLLKERNLNETANSYYLTGNNPFTDPAKFRAGSVMITNDDPDDNLAGHMLRSANLDGAGNQVPVPGVHYRVHVIDDEALNHNPLGAGPFVPNFSPSILTPWDDTPKTIDSKDKDLNNRVVVYSTGTYGSSSVTIEGWIGFVPYPAFVAQKDVTIGGSAKLEGAYGGVHSNGNLSVVGSSDIEQTATAVGTGTFTTNGTIGGFHAGGQDALYIPKFVIPPTATSSPHLQDYLVREADVILLDPGFADGATRDLTGTSPATVQLRKLADSLGIPPSQYAAFGTAIDSSTAVTVSQSGAEAVEITRDATTGSITLTHATTLLPTYGWNYSGGDWSIPSNSTTPPRTFYVVGMDKYNIANPGSSLPNGGNVKITGNAGSLVPLRMTILCTGSIEVAGNPNLVADLQGLRTPELPPFVDVNILFAAVEDLKINGDVGVGNGTIQFSGICYAGEQVYLSGNGSIQGQVLALNNRNVSGSPVDREDNEITGSFTLDFNGGKAVGKISLMSWRQIKQ